MGKYLVGTSKVKATPQHSLFVSLQRKAQQISARVYDIKVRKN